MGMIFARTAGLLAILFCVTAGCSESWAASTPPATQAESSDPAVLPENRSPEEAAAPAQAVSRERPDMLGVMQAEMHVLRARLNEMLSARPNLPSIGPFILKRITKQYGPEHVLAIATYQVVIFGAALLGEALFRRLFGPMLRRLPTLDARSDFGKVGVLLVRALVQLLNIAVFGLGATLVFFFVYEGHEAARLAFWAVFSFIILLRVSAVALHLILAPDTPTLRLPPLDDRSARRLYWNFLILVGLSVGSMLISTFLHNIGLAPELSLAGGQLLLILNVIALTGVIWGQRSAIALLVGIRRAEDAGRTKGLAALLVANWHIFAICYVFAMGIFATVHRLLTGEMQGSRVLPTLGTLIVFPLIDGLLRMTVRQFFGSREEARGEESELRQHGGDPHDPDAKANMAPATATKTPLRKETDSSGYGEVILRKGRILLGVVAVIVLSQVWNVSLEAMASRGLGTRIAESLFDIVITLILASAGWGIIRTAINRQLPHETLDALAMADGDVLGTGLSRQETLLPLLRKFLFVAMIIVVTMIVISSLGINIGPLLAGAGVVGIAVGFGAQTLVRDILSGIFFLVDDAFRTGEYIDVGEGKGTVERMSIRALMLRHHLGQLNTIPFGVIRRVTNYSRDWAIMKLELRVPYDTDLEKVRKIVKQVGREMLADPEYGPNFIQPLKSQGVHRMDDSSFIVRVKFMAKPGEQFLLRREVFRRVQEAFQESGIKFALPRVIVDAPATLTAAAAAGAAAEIEGEAKKQQTALSE